MTARGAGTWGAAAKASAWAGLVEWRALPLERIWNWDGRRCRRDDRTLAEVVE